MSQRSTLPALPPPAVFGLPPHFSAWRDYQERAVHDLAEALSDPSQGRGKRFAMSVIPTGAGKSLIYIALAILLGVRAAILTRTKALQDQLESDFTAAGLRSLRGANGYPCQALKPGGELYGTFEDIIRAQRPGYAASCEDGPCKHGIKCSLREAGCDYYDAVSAGKGSALLVTNYAYWFAQHKYGGGLGSWDLLVLDEAHETPDALSDFLTVGLERWMAAKVGAELPSGEPSAGEWAEWGGHQRLVAATARLDAVQMEIKAAREAGQRVSRTDLDEARVLKQVVGVMTAVSQVDETWVHYWKPESRAWVFAPSWPAPYAESTMFQGIPRVLLTSATVRPKTAWYLGIPDDQLTVKEYPSTFPLARRPVYFLSDAQRVDNRMTDGMRKLWARQIDRILERRTDRKGVIHTVSYQRAREIQALSEYSDRLILHTTEGTKAAIARFRALPQSSGAVLVSPSVTTGYDFKYADCEFQIITKVPFPHTADPLMKARTERDKDYALYYTLQTLVQAVGRGMRAPDDQCETFIIDAHLSWALWKHKSLVPAWFLDSVQTVGVIPAAPPRLLVA